MDDPVTDIAFVSDVAHCPKGYTLVAECPCGHDAQLWEKVLGGVDTTRYLCFAKDNDADEIIEDIYIPSAGSRYLYKGFQVIHKTIEGDSAPLRHKQLALKKVPRDKATKAVADVMVCRSRDKVSKMYKQTEKVNGLRICHRTVDYKYTPPRRATVNESDLNSRFEALSVYQQQPGKLHSNTYSDANKISSSTTTATRKTEQHYNPSPAISPPLEAYDPKISDPPSALPKSSDESGHPIDLYNYTPSPNLSSTRKPVEEGAVQVATVQSLGSAPPPSAPQPSGTTSTHIDGGTIPPAPVTQSNTAPSSGLPPVSSYPSTNPFSQSEPPSAHQQHSYPASVNPTNTYPQQYYPPAPSGRDQGGYGHKNPSEGSYPPYNPVQPRPPATGSYYQTQSHSSSTASAYNPSIGFGFTGAPTGGGYPQQQVGGYNYSSVAGSSFGQVAFDPHQRGSTGTAPFNPYHQQPGSSYPPAPTSGGTGPYPPPGAPSTNTANYGFKF